MEIMIKPHVLRLQSAELTTMGRHLGTETLTVRDSMIRLKGMLTEEQGCGEIVKALSHITEKLSRQQKNFDQLAACLSDVSTLYISGENKAISAGMVNNIATGTVSNDISLNQLRDRVRQYGTIRLS